LSQLVYNSHKNVSNLADFTIWQDFATRNNGYIYNGIDVYVFRKWCIMSKT